MKNYNGFGGISKLSGKRRRPYWARLTVGWTINEKTGKAKQVYKTLGYYPTRKEAMQALITYHANPIDLLKHDMTFAEAYEAWTPKHFKAYPVAARGLQAAFKRCASLHDMPMKDIRKAHLQQIIDGMEDMSDGSQKKVKTLFKNTFRYAMENDVIVKDYSQFVETGGKKTDSTDKFFTPEELEIALSCVDEFPLGYTFKILLYTGMRIGELLGQRTEDIDLENRVMHVRGTKTLNADRYVPIHRDIEPIIRERMNQSHLILNAAGKPMDYAGYVRNFYDKFKKRSGIEHTPHALRHTFISLMDSCGTNPIVLKRIVGHSNSDMTEHYTHKNNDELVAAIDKLVL